MHPVHLPKLDENDDDKPLVRPDHACVSEDEDDEPLVQPKLKNKVGTCHAFTGTKKKRTSSWRDPSAPAEPHASTNSRERSEEGSILGKNPNGEALRNTINKLLDERNLREPHLKHYLMSTSQFRSGQLIWTSLKKFMIFTSMW